MKNLRKEFLQLLVDILSNKLLLSPKKTKNNFVTKENFPHKKINRV